MDIWEPATRVLPDLFPSAFIRDRLSINQESSRRALLANCVVPFFVAVLIVAANIDREGEIAAVLVFRMIADARLGSAIIRSAVYVVSLKITNDSKSRFVRLTAIRQEIMVVTGEIEETGRADVPREA